MKAWWVKRQNGFTIVELLIVIVVIGILAAITIIAYNGIQQRARNAKEVSVVGQYKTALLAYALDHGTYPDSSNSACLGETYPYGCWPSSNDATFNDQLRPYLNNANPLPTGNTAPISYYGTRSGIAYDYQSGATLDGQPHPWIIVYFLEGVQTCPVGPVAGSAGGGWTNFSSTPNASGATEIYAGQNTMCVLLMPDPASL